MTRLKSMDEEEIPFIDANKDRKMLTKRNMVHRREEKKIHQYLAPLAPGNIYKEHTRPLPNNQDEISWGIKK